MKSGCSHLKNRSLSRHRILRKWYEKSRVFKYIMRSSSIFKNSKTRLHNCIIKEKRRGGARFTLCIMYTHTIMNTARHNSELKRIFSFYFYTLMYIMLYTYTSYTYICVREATKACVACTPRCGVISKYVCPLARRTYKQKDIIIILSYFRCVSIWSIPLFVSCWLFLANPVL